jgi:hypothetical protein
LQHTHSKKRPTRSTAAAAVAGSQTASAAAGGSAAAAAAVCSRHDVSRSFYELLVLQNRGYVGLSQQGAYEELVIRPTAKMLDDDL